LRVLITGGAGFIGSNLADYLLDMGCSVIVYDNFDDYYSGKIRNVRHMLDDDNFRLLRADVLNYSSLLNAMKRVDVVYHLAAQPGVRFSMANPEKTIRVNVLGTLNVLKAALKAGVGRIVDASSSSVYGNPVYLPEDELHPTNPISVYGASKLMAENLCRIFHNEFGLPVVVLRYFTVYGPRQRPDMAICRWVKAILRGDPITIYGDGSQTRDFTYVMDAVEGTVKAGLAGGIEGEVFNIGSGVRVSINDLVKMLIEICGVDDVKIKHEPPKAGDVKDTHASIAKASRLLGYRPKVDIREGLKLFVSWSRENLVR